MVVVVVVVVAVVDFDADSLHAAIESLDAMAGFSDVPAGLSPLSVPARASLLPWPPAPPALESWPATPPPPPPPPPPAAAAAAGRAAYVLVVAAAAAA
jgi:hypothetical protein